MGAPMQRRAMKPLMRLVHRRPAGQRRMVLLQALSIAVAACLANVAAAGPAMAQTDANQPAAADAGGASATFTNVFVFGRKQVALPAGTWQLVSRHFATLDELSGTGYGAIESAVLFQTDENAVAGFIIVRRNVIPIEGGWGISTDCARDDIYQTLTFDESADRPFCGFVTHVLTDVSATSDEAWKEAVDVARNRKLDLPTTWLMAGFRISDQSDILDVRYNFNPELHGFLPGAGRTWADNSWSKIRLTGEDHTGVLATLVGWIPSAIWGNLDARAPDNVQRVAALDQLGEWLSAMRFPVEAGFSNRLAMVPTMPMPWSTGQAKRQDVLPEVDARLRILDGLEKQHAITSLAYVTQRQEIMSEGQHVGGQAWSAERLTATKATTDQLTTIMTSFSADLLWTGNLTTAGTILSIATVVDLSRYSTLEYMWNTYGPRRIRPMPTLDFASAGIEQ
jgi:hypothetical protein